MTCDIIIGAGEVGSALAEVFGERSELTVHDPPKRMFAEKTRWFPYTECAMDPPCNDNKSHEAHIGISPDDKIEYDWMHIAIPWSDNIVTSVAEYAREFQPKHIIIHSTVKVGTTRKVQRECDYIPTYYSPVRGRHPHLATAIRSFPKWYATDLPGQADDDIVAYYANAGIQSRRAPSLEALEWFKLVETFTYGYQLVLWQELEREAALIPGQKHNILSAAKNWLWEKRKCYDGDIGLCPVIDLVPGPIGGHCVVENWELLKDQMTPELYAWLTKSNEMRKER